MLSNTPSAPAIYVRWSTEEQGSGTTLEEQRQTCLSFMRERRWPVREEFIFIDDGYSAGSLERPAMERLRKAVLAGQVDAVVIYKLDRLTRNIVDAVDLVLKEWDGRCALVSVTQSAIDTTNPLGRQFFTLMASFAEFEREMIRDRTMSGKKRRALQGKNPGFRPPFGYKSGETPGAIEVDEERAAVVRRIFGEYAFGRSMLEIARRLSRERVPTPGGSAGWTEQTIRYILKNPLYIGRLEYGRTSVNSPQKKKLLGRHKTVHKAPRHAVVPRAVPAILDEPVWKGVQTQLRKRSKQTGFKPRAASSSYLLTGLLKCKCGYAMAGVTGRGIDYYRCRGPVRCGSTPVRGTILDQAVLEAIRAELKDRFDQGRVEAALANMESARTSAEETAANLKAALSEIQKQRAKVLRDYMKGELTGRLYSELTDAHDREEAHMKAALAEAEEGLSSPGRAVEQARRLLENLDRVTRDAWDGLDMAQKKHTLRELVSQIVAFRAKDSAEIEFEMTLASTDDPGPAPRTHWRKIDLKEGRLLEAGD